MKSGLSTLGQFAIALAILVAAGVVAVQSTQVMGLWKQQIKSQAIDGCAKNSSYSSTQVKKEGDKEVTATDEFAITWMFDECMKNKGIEYQHTDFSTQ